MFATRFLGGIADHAAYLAMVRAYNTFLAEDYCSLAPDRLIGCAFIPVGSVDEAIDELRYIHALGLKAVSFQQFPNGTGGPVPEDDRFWETAIELGVALAPHFAFGPVAGEPMRGPDTSDQRVASAMVQHCHVATPGYPFAQMIVTGVFDRLPELRFYFAEVNCSLLPGMLYYMDRDFYGFNDWFQCDLKRKPSEYILTHALFGMVQELPAIGMGLAGLMPLDWFMWGSDFPHSVGTFPHSRKFLDDAFADVDEGTKRRILLENPARHFNLDLDADLTPTPAT